MNTNSISLRRMLLIAVFFVQLPSVSAQVQEKHEQLPKYAEIFHENISNFTLKKQGSELSLPYRGGMEIEVKATDGFFQGKEGELIVTLYTNSWYLDKNELGASYFKDIKGYLEISPGFLSITGPLALNEIQNSSKKRVDIEKESIQLKDLIQPSLFQASTFMEKYPPAANHSPRLAFQFPFLDYISDSIRTIEIRIPAKVNTQAGYLNIVLESVVLREFAKSNTDFSDPIAENVVFKVYDKKEKKEIHSSDGMSIKSEVLSTGTPDINWNLETNIDKQGIVLALDFSNTASEYIGIRSLGCILHTQKGSIEISGLPEISDSEGRKYIQTGTVLNADPEKGIQGIYPLLNSSLVKAVETEALFDDIKINKGYTYAGFLKFLWDSELFTESIKFPDYQSQLNYPLFNKQGKLFIRIPASILGDTPLASTIYFKVNYLQGNEKSALKAGQAELTFMFKED